MIYRSPDPDPDIPVTPLPAYVFARAGDHLDKPALVDGPTGRALTYGQLLAGVRQTAAGLATRGFAKGDVLALYSPNVPDYALIFFAVTSLGGVVTTVNPLYTAGELAAQIGDARARFLVTTPPLVETARAASDRIGLEELFVFGDAPGVTSCAALRRASAAAPPVTINPRDDLAALPYSSGTTGLPKGVMLTHHNLVANICQVEAIDRLAAREVLVGILPFYHIYGMVAVMSMALRRGATVVTMPRFDLERFLALVEGYRVTSAFLVPPIIQALAKHPLVDRYDLSSLRLVTSGAAPLPETVSRLCAARLGCQVRQGYGLTETSPVTHFPRWTEPFVPASIGRALPGTACRIVDPESREDVARGTPGELWIKGPQVMKGYLHAPEATREAVTPDGWLRTGDVAYVDDHDRFFIVDRLKELIKYKGFQVAPAELESLLHSHAAVADVAVVPSPDDEAGEVPKAFVVLQPGAHATAAELMAFVSQRVAPQKKIRRLEFVDAIPKVPSGKILRRRLVERERVSGGRRPG